MQPGEIYTKTEAGIREIKERKLNLPIAPRSLLIMIDGKRTIAGVLDKAHALRADAAALETPVSLGVEAATPIVSAPEWSILAHA